MSNCEHEEVELKQEYIFEFAEIKNSAAQVMYVVKLCKKCHLLYWQNAQQSVQRTCANSADGEHQYFSNGNQNPSCLYCGTSR